MGLTDFSRELAVLDGKRAEMTETLRAWCAVNSGSWNLDGVARTRALMADAFVGLLGAQTEILPSIPHERVRADGSVYANPVGDALRAFKRPDAPIQVLLGGHMDTVFPADHPFQGERFLDPDTLNAPGAADMKGGILVMMYALTALERSPVAGRIGWEAILVADEETGSHGSEHHMRAAAKRADFACVYEPSMPDGALAGARKGSGNYAVVFSGRTAHAGRDPHLGRNAVVAASRFAVGVHALAGGRPDLSVNVARIEGGAPNNVVPDRAVLHVNFRVVEPEDARWAEVEIARLVAEANAEDGISCVAHGGFTRPPKPMSSSLAAFLEALKSVGAELGVPVAWRATGGVCDGNNIADEGVPVVDTLGVRGANIHSADEYVCLDSLEERAKLSALLLMRVAAGDIPVPGGGRRVG